MPRTDDTVFFTMPYYLIYEFFNFDDDDNYKILQLASGQIILHRTLYILLRIHLTVTDIITFFTLLIVLNLWHLE